MDTNSTANPPKFSRYRAVRARAATLQTLSSQSDNEPAPAAPPPLSKAATFTPGNPDASFKRAPSRYRRNIPVATEAPPVPLPEIKNEHTISDYNKTGKQPTVIPSRYHTVKAHKPREDGAVQPSHAQAVPKDGLENERARRAHHPAPPLAPVDRYEAAREEARLILEGEYDRLQKMRAEADKRRHLAGHAIGSHAPDMKKRRDPVTPKDTRSAKSDSIPESRSATNSSPPVPAPAPDLPKPELPFSHPTSPPASPQRGLRKYILGSPKTQTPKSPPLPHASPLATTSSVPTTHPKPPPLPVPQYADAPLSASNAPDRRVTVIYDTSTITLPVTPSTTAKDLLNSASIVLSNSPNPLTSTLLETYTSSSLSLALERPIRRYERIRDIMNSWDSDTDQHLIILPPLSPSSDGPTVKGLDLRDVPPSPGRDITLQMHHTSRPGTRWEKRWVRVQPNGQVSISKHEGGMGSENICHLSDFDLYAPRDEMRKDLKTPGHLRKKGRGGGDGAGVVFAAKSQQRSAVFLNDDDDGGGRMGGEGGGGKGEKNFAHFFAFGGDRKVADTWYAAVHGWRSWYLVNVLGEGRVPASGTGEVLGEVRPELRHGRKGSLRQAQGHGAVGGVSSRPGTSASAETVPYQLGSFKPLLDLDFSNVGKNEGDGAGGGVGAGPLSAPIAGMGRRSGEARRSVDLRGDTCGHHGHSPSRSGTVRARPTTAAPPSAFPSRLVADATDNQPFVRADNDASGFTGKGLLAQQQADPSLGSVGTGPIEDTNLGFTGKGLLARSATQRSQGGRSTGRGVSGVGGKGRPLVDLTGHSEFADGSLLRQLEAWKVKHGEDAPKVDREKRVEGNVRVGEGF